MQRIQLRARAAPEVAKSYIGQQASPDHAPVVLRGDATIFKPDGEVLCIFLKGAVSQEARARAFPFFDAIRSNISYNRGAFAGGKRSRIKQNGQRTNTSESLPVRSAIAGFLDRYPRIPYCRESAITTTRPELWSDMQQEVREVATHFQQHLPKRYAAQSEKAKKTHPAYVIPGSPFTTLTINNTVSGCYHLDAGDYAPGFGCITVFRVGHYDGCLLVFPAFGVAADLGDRDLLLFDPHEVHGNTPFIGEGTPGEDFRRISVVHYFREKMEACLPPAEELERVKTMQGSIDREAAEPADGEDVETGNA